jgi:uncharacterized membrane protein
MNQWMQFLFGTPRRVIGTLIAMFFIAVIINPQILHFIFARLMCAINPILGPIIQLAIVFFGIRYMFRAFFGGGSGSRRHR